MHTLERLHKLGRSWLAAPTELETDCLYATKQVVLLVSLCLRAIKFGFKKEEEELRKKSCSLVSRP